MDKVLFNQTLAPVSNFCSLRLANRRGISSLPLYSALHQVLDEALHCPPKKG